jgi:hypothetical protein
MTATAHATLCCPQCGFSTGRGGSGPAISPGLTAVTLVTLCAVALLLIPVAGRVTVPVLLFGAMTAAGAPRPHRQCPGCGYFFPVGGETLRWMAVAVIGLMAGAAVLYAVGVRYHF